MKERPGAFNAFVVAVCLAMGWLLAAGHAGLLAAAPAASVVPLSIALAARYSGNERVLRYLLILGAFGPLLYVSNQTDSVDTSVGISALVRGGVPFAALGLAHVVGLPKLLPRRLTLPEKALVGFAIMAFGSLTWSAAPATTALKATVLAASFLCLSYLVRSYRSAIEALHGFVTLVYTVLIWTLIQALAAPSSAFAQLTGGISRLRSVIPSIHSNQLSHIALIGLLSVLLNVMPPRLRGRLAVRLGLGALFAVELLAARSRSALAIGSVMLVVAGLHALRRSAFAGVVVAWGLLPLFFLVATQGDTLSSFLRRGQSDRAFFTLTGRTLTWDSALDFAAQRPVLGHGYYTGHRLAFAEATGAGASNLDNAWVETLVNLGYLGTMLLAAFVLGAFWLAVRRFPIGGTPKMFLALTISYFAFASFINPSVQGNNSSQIMLGFAALTACHFAVRSPWDAYDHVGEHPKVSSSLGTVIVGPQRLRA